MSSKLVLEVGNIATATRYSGKLVHLFAYCSLFNVILRSRCRCRDIDNFEDQLRRRRLRYFDDIATSTTTTSLLRRNRYSATSTTSLLRRRRLRYFDDIATSTTTTSLLRRNRYSAFLHIAPDLARSRRLTRLLFSCWGLYYEPSKGR